MTHLSAPTTLRRIARQRGLTLIELMVALVVGLMVILAAMSVFTATGRSSRTVDSAGQLRDDARFAAEIIQRLAVQTGFEDIGFVTRPYYGTPQAYKGGNGDAADPLTMQAPISGLSGKLPVADMPEIVAGGNSYNGSDTLVLRYQAVNRPGSEGDADGSMMLCDGSTLGAGDGHSATFRNHRAISIFYVAADPNDGEPTLYCAYTNDESVAPGNGTPLVKGVESFNVLYGVDNIEPETAADCRGSGGSSCETEHAKLVPNRYLTADDMIVAGDTAATQTNWRRVRALRIGLVLRTNDRIRQADGSYRELPVQSGQAKAQQSITPLGKNFGASYAVNDARLRRDYTFTINVRNCLNQGYQSAGDPGSSAAANIPPCDVVVPRDPNA